MADFGYDIADYTGIDPVFGAMQDFETLLEAAHSNGLKLLLDFVPNHTSDQHPWFLESRSSSNNPKRDWYIWQPPARNGAPPNNWLSEFGGSAWELDPSTGQYYYHAFLKQQPDLNWRNPDVREAMYEVMRFWFRKGVDGFRIDVLWHLLKDEQFRDNPANPNFGPGDPPHHALMPLYTTDLPEIHDVIADMRAVADSFGDRVLIGEIYLPIERLVAYYGRNLRGVHLPFNFSLIGTTWHARRIASLIDEYEGALPKGGWPNWVLGNHDRPRVATRVGAEQARVAAMLLLTLRGTPTIYYGDEIGMEQVLMQPHQLRDAFEANVPGLGLGRDGCRTPMQWDAGPHAGFSSIEPWLPVAPCYREINVAKERADPDSIFRLHRELIAVRRTHPALARGTYWPLAADGDLLVFIRESGQERLFVALNLGGKQERAKLPDGDSCGKVVLSTFLDRSAEHVSAQLELRPHEGIILELVGARR